MFRLPETFALTRRRFRDFRPLPYPHPCASPLLCALGHALARRARVRRRSTHVRQPSACRLPIHPPIHPSTHPFPTHLFHVKHVRTIPAHNQATCARADSLARRHAPTSLVSASLRRRRSWRCRASGSFLPYSRVSRETSEHRPLSLASQFPPIPAQLKMRRRTHTPTALTP